MRQQILPQLPLILNIPHPRTRNRVLIQILDTQILRPNIPRRISPRSRSKTGGLTGPVQLQSEGEGEIALEETRAGSGGGDAEICVVEEEEEGEEEGGEEDVFEAWLHFGFGFGLGFGLVLVWFWFGWFV